MPTLFPILIDAFAVSEITSSVALPDAFLICKSADGADVPIPIEPVTVTPVFDVSNFLELL